MVTAYTTCNISSVLTWRWCRLGQQPDGSSEEKYAGAMRPPGSVQGSGEAGQRQRLYHKPSGSVPACYPPLGHRMIARCMLGDAGNHAVTHEDMLHMMLLSRR